MHSTLKLFPVLIRTVLKDPEGFHDYLTQNLTMTDNEATAIIEGTINYASVSFTTSRNRSYLFKIM